MTSVVLVDDHKLLREGIRSLIENSGEFHVVAEASDGREAIELVAAHRPDLVLMDIWLPRLSGIEAIAQIRHEVPRCKVVMMSQHENASYVEASLREGACGYVVKTAAFTDLLAALRAAVQDKCYLSPDVARLVVDSFHRPQGEPASPLQSLTGREREVLQLIAEGLSSKEVASQLSVSTRTVEAHRAAVMGKLHIHKVAGLVRFAIREGVIAP